LNILLLSIYKRSEGSFETGKKSIDRSKFLFFGLSILFFVSVVTALSLNAILKRLGVLLVYTELELFVLVFLPVVVFCARFIVLNILVPNSKQNLSVIPSGIASLISIVFYEYFKWSNYVEVMVLIFAMEILSMVLLYFIVSTRNIYEKRNDSFE
jgi:hypothetical protein